MARGAAALPLRPVASRRLRSGALSMDTQRLILLFIFGFSALMLWESWQKETRPKPAPSAAVAQQSVPATPSESPRPGKPAATAPAELPASVPGGQANATKGQTLRVNTDL